MPITENDVSGSTSPWISPSQPLRIGAVAAARHDPDLLHAHDP
jgi:hypothetical protein